MIMWWRLKEDNPKIKFRETVLKKVDQWIVYRTVGAEEHDDFESRTRGVEHYSRAEIPRI